MNHVNGDRTGMTYLINDGRNNRGIIFAVIDRFLFWCNLVFERHDRCARERQRAAPSLSLFLCAYSYPLECHPTGTAMLIQPELITEEGTCTSFVPKCEDSSCRSIYIHYVNAIRMAERELTLPMISSAQAMMLQPHGNDFCNHTSAYLSSCLERLGLASRTCN